LIKISSLISFVFLVTGARFFFSGVSFSFYGSGISFTCSTGCFTSFGFLVRLGFSSVVFSYSNLAALLKLDINVVIFYCG